MKTRPGFKTERIQLFKKLRKRNYGFENFRRGESVSRR